MAEEVKKASPGSKSLEKLKFGDLNRLVTGIAQKALKEKPEKSSAKEGKR